jgi:hypothetical protein
MIGLESFVTLAATTCGRLLPLGGCAGAPPLVLPVILFFANFVWTVSVFDALALEVSLVTIVYAAFLLVAVWRHRAGSTCAAACAHLPDVLPRFALNDFLPEASGNASVLGCAVLIASSVSLRPLGLMGSSALVTAVARLGN